MHTLKFSLLDFLQEMKGNGLKPISMQDNN